MERLPGGLTASVRDIPVIMADMGLEGALSAFIPTLRKQAIEAVENYIRETIEIGIIEISNVRQAALDVTAGYCACLKA